MHQLPTVDKTAAVLLTFLPQEGVQVLGPWCQDTAARMLGLKDWNLSSKPTPRTSAVILQNAVRELDALLKFSRAQQAVALAYGVEDWAVLTQQPSACPT